MVTSDSQMSNEIIHSTSMFKNTDSFTNKTSDCSLNHSFNQFIQTHGFIQHLNQFMIGCVRKLKNAAYGGRKENKAHSNTMIVSHLVY